MLCALLRPAAAVTLATDAPDDDGGATVGALDDPLLVVVDMADEEVIDGATFEAQPPICDDLASLGSGCCFWLLVVHDTDDDDDEPDELELDVVDGDDDDDADDDDDDDDDDLEEEEEEGDDDNDNDTGNDFGAVIGTAPVPLL